MKVLELFSGTHSIGKVCKELGYEVVSLDRDLGGKCPFGTDYESDIHIQEDIMTWDYKKDFKVGEFDLITASPVCLWWSMLRNSNLGRKLKGYGEKFTKEDIENDITKYGEPMVDKVFEIIDWFCPRFYWIENPQTSRMKEYINDLIPYYDVDYCKYGFEYKKKTRIWTNIEGFIPLLCKKKNHKIQIGRGKGGGATKLEKYRIPSKLISALICLAHS
jgi:site-specific DNA-cytosine methylase